MSRYQEVLATCGWQRSFGTLWGMFTYELSLSTSTQKGYAHQENVQDINLLKG